MRAQRRAENPLTVFHPTPENPTVHLQTPARPQHHAPKPPPAPAPNRTTRTQNPTCPRGTFHPDRDSSSPPGTAHPPAWTPRPSRQGHFIPTQKASRDSSSQPTQQSRSREATRSLYGNEQPRVASAAAQRQDTTASRQALRDALSSRPTGNSARERAPPGGGAQRKHGSGATSQARAPPLEGPLTRKGGLEEAVPRPSVAPLEPQAQVELSRERRLKARLDAKVALRRKNRPLEELGRVAAVLDLGVLQVRELTTGDRARV